MLTGSKTLPAQRRIFNILHLNFDTSTINNIMVNSYSAIEDRIDSAIDALHDGLYTNCRAAAIAFDVAPRTVQKRWNGGNSKSSRPSTNKALTDEQEQAVRDYIERLDKANMCARPKLIVGAANYLIRFENRTLGHQWLKRFLDRNPELHVRKQKPLAVDRKNSHDVNDMVEYFSKLERVMREKGITELDVWNMDETGFRIGCGRAQIVITLDPRKPLRMTDPDNRDYITSVECISSAGDVIPPLLILSGIHILHKWCQHNDLDGETLIGTSETGYSNDDLAMDWLRHFIEHTRTKRRGAWLLLVIDGFGSHSTIPFLKLATENQIVLFRLPAHSTHLTQPLDVGVFQPYKHYHAEAIDHAIRMGDTEFGKLEFLAAFQEFRNKTFKSSTIRHAFRTTGIVPFNPNMVLDVIRQKQAAALEIRNEPRTPSPLPLQFHERTPRGPESIRKFGHKLQRALTAAGPIGGWMDKKTVDGFQKFIRASITSANTLDLTTRDLQQVQKATTSRKSRAALGGQVAAKGGVIKVSQCRELCSIRQKKEEEKARRKEQREANKGKKASSTQLDNVRFLLGQGLLVEQTEQ